MARTSTPNGLHVFATPQYNAYKQASVIATRVLIMVNALPSRIDVIEPEFVVVDCETTGLDPAQDALVEVAALRFRKGVLVNTFETLVNPGRPIPATASAVHLITDADVADAPDDETALWDLSEFVGHAVVVAHNANFDRAFLTSIGGGRWICSLRFARHLWPNAPGYGNQLLRFWLRLNDPRLNRAAIHRASTDAFVTGLIFLRELAELPRLDPLPDYEDVADFVASAVPVHRLNYGRKHRDSLLTEIPEPYLRWILDDTSSPAPVRRMTVDGDTLAAVHAELRRRANKPVLENVETLFEAGSLSWTL